MAELDELETSLSEQEQQLYENLKESFLNRLEGEPQSGEKARKAALLSIKKERISNKSLKKWIDGLDDSKKVATDEIVNVEEKNIEASKEYREYLEKIGIYPMEPQKD